MRWVDKNNLLEEFFPHVDRVLKKSALSLQQIDEFRLEQDNPTGYTTRRMAKTIIDTLSFAVETDDSAQSVDKS